jgi:hypothetical protein
MSKEALARQRSKLVNSQPHPRACGPIALVNVIRWFGIRTSIRKVIEFTKQIHAWSPKIGMYPFQMAYALRTMRIPFRVKKHLTVQGLDRLIDSGCAVILVYQMERYNGSHVVFITGRSKDGYLAWNHIQGHPPWFAREKMKKTLRRSCRLKHGMHAYIFQGVTVKK